MGAQAVLQANKTFSGDNSASASPVTVVNEGQDRWVDAGNWANGIITVRVSSLSASGSDTVDVSVGTTHDKGYVAGSLPTGMVETVVNFSDVDAGWYKHAAVVGDSSVVFDRWLGLSVVVNGTAGPWSINLEAWVTLKTPA